MHANFKVKIDKSTFRETLDVLREMNDNHISKGLSRTRVVNENSSKNDLIYVGTQLKKYSVFIRSQKITKPTKLPIAGS